MEVVFDAVKQQQVLSFSFALQISIQELLKALNENQAVSARPPDTGTELRLPMEIQPQMPLVQDSGTRSLAMDFSPEMPLVQTPSQAAASHPARSSPQPAATEVEDENQKVVVMEKNQIENVFFADQENDKVAFQGLSAIGLYSARQGRVTYKRARNREVEVCSMAVNPEMGTIAIFLESSGHNIQQRSIVEVWPTGQLQDEEPLMIMVQEAQGSPKSTDDLAPMLAMSRISSSLTTLMCRLRNEQVIVWRLDASRSQVISESVLSLSGSLISVSGDGLWMAVQDAGPPLADGGSRRERKRRPESLQVWTMESPSNRRGLPTHPQRIADLQSRPIAMSVDNEASPASCVLAFVEEAEGQAAPVIQVLRVALNGAWNSLYQVTSGLPGPFRCLSFLHQDPERLLGVQDGRLTIFELAKGSRFSRSHRSQGGSCAPLSATCIAPDGKLAVTCAADSLRVFKVESQVFKGLIKPY
jgi:hypothetical protein